MEVNKTLVHKNCLVSFTDIYSARRHTVEEEKTVYWRNYFTCHNSL